MRLLGSRLSVGTRTGLLYGSESGHPGPVPGLPQETPSDLQVRSPRASVSLRRNGSRAAVGNRSAAVVTL